MKSLRGTRVANLSKFGREESAVRDGKCGGAGAGRYGLRLCGVVRV